MAEAPRIMEMLSSKQERRILCIVRLRNVSNYQRRIVCSDATDCLTYLPQSLRPAMIELYKIELSVNRAMCDSAREVSLYMRYGGFVGRVVQECIPAGGRTPTTAPRSESRIGSCSTGQLWFD